MSARARRGWQAGALGLAPLLLAAGFAAFVLDAASERRLPRDSDGIVVLTGGALRVETGVALLDARVAPRLLVSGVGDGVTVASLLEATWHADAPGLDHAPPATILAIAPDERRITLGHLARSTAGNAIETADWARASGLRSLVVVTAGYHMRRALTEIHAAIPDVTLRPYPVHPRAPLRLLAVEYLKYLAVASGLVALPIAAGNT